MNPRALLPVWRRLPVVLLPPEFQPRDETCHSHRRAVDIEVDSVQLPEHTREFPYTARPLPTHPSPQAEKLAIALRESDRRCRHPLRIRCGQTCRFDLADTQCLVGYSNVARKATLP